MPRAVQSRGFTQHHFFAQQKSGAGFTFIELLVSIAVLAIMMTISVLAVQNFAQHGRLRVATQDVRTLLIDARNDTLSSEGDTGYGVHIDETSVTLFAGPSYSSTSPTNTIVSFDGSVSATTSLSGGATDVTFKRLSGEASATGTVLLTDTQGGATKTVTIYESGLVE